MNEPVEGVEVVEVVVVVVVQVPSVIVKESKIGEKKRIIFCKTRQFITKKKKKKKKTAFKSRNGTCATKDDERRQNVKAKEF
jgi:hypothetical protein